MDRVHVAGELASELRAMTSWLGLDEIAIGRKGDLTSALRKAV
jgi:hypothetical protein